MKWWRVVLQGARFTRISVGVVEARSREEAIALARQARPGHQSISCWAIEAPVAFVWETLEL